MLFVGLISETPSGNSVVAACKFLQPIKVKPAGASFYVEIVKLTDKPISFGVASWTVIHLTFATQPYKSKNPT